ncbi:MAG: hypothetical protein JNL98_05595 [Bryobacterales bacterium]|nr:hypothetical protein [Bryobacterales bacterium]
MRLALILAFTSFAAAQPPPGHEPVFLRLAEEAEAFARTATKVVGQEKLEQVAADVLPRFQMRGAKPHTPFKTRQIVSEYAFSTLPDDPGNLHELRQVLTVDGKRVKAPGKMRETLTMGQKTEADKAKKRMLKEFESYGLREAATDFGQMILLFTQRSQANFKFAPARTENIAADSAIVFVFEQKAGDSAMTVFEGRNVARIPLRGELFLRARDGVPLRITLDFTETVKDVPLRRYAIVDYQISAHGFVLPVSVIYSESASGKMLVENRFQYTDFKMFGASSDVKFTAEEELPKK